MQTGYDSWMYQNSRPEPLHNLQNNNHYSNAVFTDSNRHVQNGRLLSHFNNCMQPPSNVAYYHQNSQYRTNDFHQLPSSMYLEPFRPSNINNTQPRRASVNWSGRSGYLPQNSYTHENFSAGCLENHNRSSQVSSSVDKNNIKINPAPAISSIHQISRIRVKDVHSINNNNISDSFLHKAMLQTHSKQQRGNVINCGSNNYSAVDLNPQTKFIDNTYVAQPKLPPPYYRFTASEQPQQSCSRFGSRRPSTVVSENNTSSFVPQEIHHDSYSPDNMLQRACTNEKPLENTNPGQSGSVQTYDQITCGIFNASNNSQIQNCGQNDLESTAYSETLSSSKMSNYGTFGISNSSHVLTIPDCHENVSKSSDANLGGFNSPKTPKSNLNTQLSSNPETSTNYPKQEGTLIKISIPHTGQSSFIRLNDSNSTNNSLNFSLPCLLDSNNECFNTATKDRLSNNKININERINSSVLQTGENIPTAPTSVEFRQNFSSSVLSNACSLRKVTSPKQFFINVNKESVSNSVPQSDLNSKTGIKKVSKMSIPEEDIKLNLLTVKQEKSLTSAESLRESDYSESDDDDDFDRIITKKKIPVAETKNIPLEEPEKSKSLENSVPKRRMLKKRIRQHISYRSKINRVKLDMLIQFLRKDDEPGQASLETPCEKTTNENVKCRNREKHRIRKLSKASIVRNKNISREMVSLVSQKTPRVDPSKSSSETSHTVNSNADSQKVKEEKDNSAETGENLKNENFASFSEHQSQTEDSSQSERNNNKLVTGEVQKPAFECLTGERDKEIINMMRILRSMTTNFCRNCKLNSSADSFWVNVVSFELRCLNCFKKFLSKELTTKGCGYDTGTQEVNWGNESNLKDGGNSTSKETHHEKTSHLKEENLTAKLPEDSSKGRWESFEKSSRKKSLKDEDMIDERKNAEENVSLENTTKKSSSLPNAYGEKSERKSSFCEEDAGETSREKSILKYQHVDNRSRSSENECENGKLLRTPSKKVEKKEDIPKREEIENVNTQKRKSSTESAPRKTSMADEYAEREVKRLMDSREKERSIEQPKISKYGKPEMSEISRIPPKSKEISSSYESKSKSDSSDSEIKKLLKRKHSSDDPSPRKVYIPDDNSTERMEVVTHPSEKTKSTTTLSKDVNHKNKPESENQDSKSSTDKSKAKDVFTQKIKSTDQKHGTDDSIRSPRQKTIKGRRETK